MSNQTKKSNRLAPKEESKLNVKALSDPDNIKALNKLYNMFKKCFGPFSSNILFQNDLGGIVTSTSSCVKLINVLPIENPLVRLVTTATVGHGNNFSDASLFTALLTLSLFQEALKLDMHRHLISTVFELLLGNCLSYLSSENCTAKIKLNFASTEEMLKLAVSVISTKPGSMIDEDEAHQIARLVLVSFISGLSEKDTPNLHMITVEGQQPMKSEVKAGFIYDAPELWTDDDKPVHCRTVGSGSGSQIRTVLVGCSMAGDSEDYIDGDYEIHRSLRKEDVVIQRIKQWIDSVVKLDIGILFCQKVVHTDIKELLRKLDIVVIERLGTKGANTVSILTGRPLLHSLHSALTPSQCGTVLSIHQLGLYGKTYLHVRGVSEEVSTLMLCHHSEDALDELKVSCDQAYSVLRSCLSQPYALHGGGCWLTQMAHHVTKQTEDPSWLAEAAECPSRMLSPIVRAFLCSLRRLPALLRRDRDHYVDASAHHHWMLLHGDEASEMDAVRCACGAVTWNEDVVLVAFEDMMDQAVAANDKSELCANAYKTPNVRNRVGMYSRNMMKEEEVRVEDASVLDSFAACVNGLQTAVLATNMLLGVSNVISDCN